MEGKFNQFFFIWTKNQKIWIIYAWLFFFSVSGILLSEICV